MVIVAKIQNKKEITILSICHFLIERGMLTLNLDMEHN